jgi:hypothetical protein
MKMLEIECPDCDSVLELGDDLQGERIECPICEFAFYVPHLPELEEVILRTPKSKKVRSRSLSQYQDKSLSPNYPIVIEHRLPKNKNRSNIHIVCWILYTITFILVAVPFYPTFWLWIPLYIAGLVCTIIAFTKTKYATGVLGLIWSIVGVWLWWFVSGMITLMIWPAESIENAAGIIVKDGIFEGDKDYINKLKILDFNAQRNNNNVPEIQLRIKNNGQKAVKALSLKIFFMDAKGNTIFENKISVINPFTDPPLKPGYISSVKQASFRGCPPEWEEGKVRYEVESIRFK